MAIGVAIIGAGTFVRDEHLPAVKACPSFSLKAVYSRSEAAAKNFAATTGLTVDTYYDSGTTASGLTRALPQLLARDDIQAVIIALPTHLQTEIIKKALEAGKHVLSEKPMAKDVKTANGLLKWYHKSTAQQKKPLWAVAENFRFMASILYGAHQLKELGGQVIAFNMTLYGFVDQDGKYHNEKWRQDPTHKSSFLLNNGIHYLAGLRFLLFATHTSMTHVAAFTSLLQPRLKPVDTAHATLKLANGHSGTFSISFSTEFKSAFEMEIVTEKGAVKVTPTEVETRMKDGEGKLVEERKVFRDDNRVKREVSAFAESIEKAREDVRGSPEQALEDLKVVEAILESGEGGGKVVKIS